jgi:hypothetical protein
MLFFDWLFRRRLKGRRQSAALPGSEAEKILAAKAAFNTVEAGDGAAAGHSPKLSGGLPEGLTQTPNRAKDGPRQPKNIWDLEDPSGDLVASAAQAEPVADASRRRRSTRTKTRVLGFEPQAAAVVPLFDEGRMDGFAEAGGKASVVQFPTGWLVVKAGPGRGTAFALSQGVSQIGRGSDQTVALEFGDMAISRQNHAAIAYDGGTHQFHLGHGGKSNLVRLNGKPLLSTEVVRDGDEIQIGETTLLLKVLCTPSFNWSASDAGGDGHDVAIA